MTISPATADQRPDAVRLLFQHLGRDSVAEKLLNIEAMIAAGEMEADAIWLARDTIGPAAAMIASLVPGGSAALWPPRARTSLHNENAVLDQLVAAVIATIRHRNITMAQALLSESEAVTAGALERNGFTKITTLLTLRHFLDLSSADMARPERLIFRSIDEVSNYELETTLLRTYAGSLDCPEVNGRRSAAEILAGHRGVGPFDPSNWWLAYWNNEAVAILLCNQTEVDTWDVVYLGVAREARGRGFGRELIGHALLEAKAADMLIVTITVDERNNPARALYRRAGFESFEERGVWLL